MVNVDNKEEKDEEDDPGHYPEEEDDNQDNNLLGEPDKGDENYEDEDEPEEGDLLAKTFLSKTCTLYITCVGGYILP